MRDPARAFRAVLLLLLSAHAQQHACPSPFSRGDLPPALEFCDGVPVRTPDDWALRRTQLGGLLQEHIYGTLPPPNATPALLRVALTNSSADYGRGFTRRWHRATFVSTAASVMANGDNASLSLEFETLFGAACTAAARCPVVLVSREHRRWGVAAALRGYVAVSMCVGDSCPWATAPWAAAFPSSTFALIAQRAYVTSRTLDAVLTLPYADGGHVGAMGHSRNGKLSLIAAAFDARIGCVVDSSSGAAGISPYRYSGGEAQCERPGSTWPGAWWLPSLRAFDGREDALPVDSHSVAALIAPRPLLIASAMNDGVEPTFAVERAFEEAAAVYAFLGANASSLMLDYRAGDHHGFERIDRYLDWLDAAFNHTTPNSGRARSAPRFPVPAGSGAGGSDSGIDGRFHAFNWSAWALVAGPPPSLPPPSAPARERWAWLLGESPLGASGPPWDSGGSYPPASDLAYVDVLQLRDEGATAFRNVTRHDVAFGQNVFGASLLFRADMMTAPPPSPAGWPAIVYLPSHNYNKGPVSSYAPANTSLLAPAHAFANESFVVLTYDQLGHGLRIGEGAQFYARHPRWSRLGASIFDAMSAIDLLSTPQAAGMNQGGADDDVPPFPRVDPSRIFVVGYGAGGGAAALLTAASDARVAGVATVSGWTPLRNDTDASRGGGIRRFYERHATLPRLGFFADGRGEQVNIPADFVDALTLVRPRPALVLQPMDDRMNDAGLVRDACTQLQARGYSALELQTPRGVNAMGGADVAAVSAWARATKRQESKE